MLHQSPLLEHLFKRACSVFLCLIVLSVCAFALQPATAVPIENAVSLSWLWIFSLFGLFCLGTMFSNSRQLAEEAEFDKPFAKIFDDLPVPMAIMRISDVVFISANQEFQRLTRLTLADIAGKTHQQAGFEVAPADQQRFYDCILSQPRVRNYELQVRFFGHELVLLISSEHIRFNGEPCLLGSFQNITARKQAEERFAKAFHANPISMTILSRRNYRIIETNASTLKLMGLTLAEMQGKTLHELQVRIAPETWQEIGERLAATGKLSDYEFKVIYQGRERYLLAGAEYIDFNGEPCILWSQQDITERKLAEERFAKAFYANPMPMCISRASDLRFIAVNDSTLRFTGYTREEMLGKTRCELGMVATEAEEQTLLARLQTDGTVRDFETNVSLKGNSHTLLVSVESIVLNDEPCWLWATQDITERKLAEERFAKAFNANPNPMALVSRTDHRFVQINRAWSQMSGIAMDQVVGHTTSEINLWAQSEQQQAFYRLLEETGRVHNFEANAVLPSGQEQTFLLYAEPLTLNDQPHLLTCSFDITERKRAEAALQESQARLRIALEATALGIWEHDLQTNLVELDERAQAHFGLPSGCPIAEILRRIHPEDYGASLRLMRSMLDAQTEQPPHSLEYRWLHPDGTTRWLRFDAQVSFAGEGPNRHPVRSIGTSLDITERKLAEEALRESELRYRGLIEDQTEFVTRWLPDGTRTFVNDSYCRFLGITREEALGTSWFPTILNAAEQEALAQMAALTPDQPLHQMEHFSEVAGKPIWTHWSNRAFFDEAGQIIEYQSVGRDITKRKQAEEAVRTSELRYRRLVEDQPDFLVRWKPDGNRTFVNDSYCRFFGLERETAIGTSWLPLLNEDDPIVRKLANVSLVNPIIEWEHQCPIPNGEVAWTHWINRALFDETGQLTEFQSVGRDVTERKQAEERFAKTFYENAVPMSIVRAADDVIIEVNQAYATLTGWSREEVLGKTCAESGFSFSIEDAQRVVAQLRSADQINPLEVTAHFKTGVKTLLSSASLMSFNGIECVLWSDQDITERKQTEEVAQRWQSVFSQSELGLAHTNVADNTYLDVNEAYARARGYIRAELIGQPVRMIYPPSEFERISQIMAEVDQAGHRVLETIHQRKDGSQFPILMELVAIRDAQGRSVSRISYSIDITERKQAEVALQTSEAKFRTLADTTQASILIQDGERYIYVNPAGEQLFGYSQAEWSQLSFIKIAHPDSRKQMEQRQAARLRGELVSARNEAKIITKTGEVRWIDYSVGAIKAEDHSYRIITAFDITERKQAEAGLQTSEAKFRALAETSQAAIFIYDDEDRFVYANPASQELFGYTPNELIRHTIWDVIHPDSRPVVAQRQAARLRGEEVTPRNEIKICNQRGETRWVDYSIGVLEFGGRECRIVTAFDITERKQAEENLRASEVKFRALAETAQMGISISNEHGFIYVNPATEQLYGYSREEFKQLTWRDLVHPEARLEAEARWQARQQQPSRDTSQGELKLISKTGQPIWVSYSTGNLELDGQRYMISTSFNITERKQAEEELRVSEERFAAAFNASPDAMAITTFDEGRYVLVNDAWVRIFGINREEALGQQFRNLRIWVDDTQRYYVFNQVRTAGLVVDHEVTGQTSEGQPITLLITAKLIRLGAETFVLSVSKDITERKRVEVELQASQAELRNLAGRLQNVREEERAAIAREIHDELGQALTGIKMDLKWLERLLPLESVPARERLASVYSLIGNTVQSVRQLATSLRPGVLDDFGLVAALEWQAREFTTRTGIACDFTELSEELPLDPAHATALFRIFQETLTNVARHAEATQVNARLHYEHNNLHLQIHDNGKGISADEIKNSRSLGLVGMRERALLLGGKFSIEGGPGMGTTIDVQIPLTAHSQPGSSAEEDTYDSHLDR
jgi:PAS domain S-box-containing protein